MFDEEDIRPKSDSFNPRILDNMSVEELEEYIEELQTEIQRVQDDITAKKASISAAESVFK